MDTEGLPKHIKKLAAELNPRQLAFCNLILLQHENGLATWECHREAGYSFKNENSSTATAAKMLINAKISAYIEAMKAHSAEKTGLTLEYLDKKLKSIIDVEVSDFIKTVPVEVQTPDGPTVVHKVFLKESVDELPDNVLGAINAVKLTKEGIQYVLPDKKGSLELAYKRLGGILQKHEVSGPNGKPLVNVTPEDINTAITGYRKSKFPGAKKA